MEDKIKDLDKMLKVLEARNELLEEEKSRNDEAIKKIVNEITIIMENSDETSVENFNVNLKSA